jgi:anaerobic magnesium-protoporphyrin IX monomethyl ester cyclase
MLRIALINGPLQSTVCDHGVGHQLPLGLLMIGGPLAHSGFQVKLIDAACHHLTDPQVLEALTDFAPQVVMVGHVGSTQAHPSCLRLLRAIKAAIPTTVTVYGGVHATYHFRAILAEHPEVDVIVRGEGEATVLDLATTLANRLGMPAYNHVECHGIDLSNVASIAWRSGSTIVANLSRQPIADLDHFPIGWKLITDWDAYQAFGLGRAGVVQFSRGCPFNCTFCGQWMFWKRWRHRDIAKFVNELESLNREHNVRFFWLADENPTTEREIWKALLQEIVHRNLDIRMCASIRAQDVVRDEDLVHLYRKAGFLYVLLGIETVTDETLRRVRKQSCVDDAYRAIRILRRHGILSICDYIFGLDGATLRTIVTDIRGLQRYDADFLNALYVTPHAWTPLGRELKGEEIIENDLGKWDYRHQIVAVKGLSPAQVFATVKFVEASYHLHPRRIWRLLTLREPQMRRHLRRAYWHITKVYWVEVLEYFWSCWNAKRRLKVLANRKGVRSWVRSIYSHLMHTPKEMCQQSD